MAQTFTNLLTHVIFSTKERRPLLKTEIRPRLFSYMGGIVRDLSGKALIINGTSDHVHLLVSMPATITIAEMMRIVKSKSSGWVREQFASEGAFAWQAGYGAFSVSHANVDAVKEYIAGQEEHHKKVSFQEELLSFLRKQGIEFDERYIWKAWYPLDSGDPKM